MAQLRQPADIEKRQRRNAWAFGIQLGVLTTLLATTGFSTIRSWIYYWQDSGDGYSYSAMRRDRVGNQSSATWMRVFRDSPIAPNDEAPLFVSVEYEDPSPYADLPCRVVLNTVSLQFKQLEPIDSRIGARYVVWSPTTGSKFFETRLVCGDRTILETNNGEVIVASQEQPTDWWFRAVQLAQLIGFPTLIALFITELLRRRNERRSGSAI